MKKYTQVLVVSASLVLGLLSVIFIFSKSELSECVRFYAGNVSLKMHYNNDIFSMFKNGDIRINRTNEIVGIIGYELPYAPVEELLVVYKADLDHDYKEANFNGHEAVSIVLGKWDHYKIPFGNRVIAIDYSFSGLSEEEREMLQKTIDDITLDISDEDIRSLEKRKCEY